MRRGTWSKLAQNTSTIAAIHAFERDRTGQVLQPADGRLRTQITTILRQPPDRHLERRIGFEQVAVVAVGIARRDQQGPVADHLGERMPHPFRRSPVLDAIGQALGDPQPLLDCRQQQYPGVRGHQAAIEGQVHRLARDRWQTRQNRRSFVHGGCELRWLRLIRRSNQIIHESKGLCRSRQPFYAA